MAAKNSTDAPKAKRNVSVEALDTSDQALAKLLNRLKTSVDANEIRELSEQIEHVIFHKQFENA